MERRKCVVVSRWAELSLYGRPTAIEPRNKQEQERARSVEDRNGEPRLAPPGLPGFERGGGLDFLRVTPRYANVPCASLTFPELAKAFLLPMRVEAAEDAIEKHLGAGNAILFASGRGALAAAIALLAPGGSVAVSGYTCTAVPNAVFAGGAQPVYVDVDACGLVPAERWPAADAILIQDTYGFQASVPARGPVVLDAALSGFRFLPAPGVTVTVTSFEQTKPVSAGQGGLAVTTDEDFAERLRLMRDRAEPGRGERLGLWHAALTLLQLSSGRLRYGGRHGGYLTANLFTRLSPLRAAGQSPAEFSGGGADHRLLGRPPRTVARLIVGQVSRSAALAEHRGRIVEIYDRAVGLKRDPQPLSRYPMVAPDVERVDRAMRDAGWFLDGRWFEAPLHPARANPRAFGLDPSAVPCAVELSRTVINLPTHPLVTASDAAQLIEVALRAGAQPLWREGE